MQRLNRPAHAPLGMAFFLFLGLAIVPVSLKAAGVHLSFSPSLSAAADAWREISEVFGASYQQSRDAQPPVVTNPDSDVTPSDSDCKNRFVACTDEAKQIPLSIVTVPAKISPKSRCSRSAHAVVTVLALPSVTLSESDSTSVQAEVKLEETTKLLKSIAVMKLDAAHKSLNDVERRAAVQRSFARREYFKSIPAPASLRVLLQLKPPVMAPSAARRPVECKVRLASMHRDDSEDTPDNASSFDDFDL